MTSKSLKLFTHVGEALYGERWAAAMAQSLGVTTRHMAYLTSQQRPLPEDVWERLETLVREHVTVGESLKGRRTQRSIAFVTEASSFLYGKWWVAPLARKLEKPNAWVLQKRVRQENLDELEPAISALSAEIPIRLAELRTLLAELRTINGKARKKAAPIRQD